MLVLLPMFVAILQLGLALYVRNTIAACAQEGARYGADADFVSQGSDVMAARATDRTASCIDSAISSTFSRDVTASTPSLSVAGGSSVPAVEVRVAAPLPVVGLLGLGDQVLHVQGDAMQEAP